MKLNKKILSMLIGIMMSTSVSYGMDYTNYINHINEVAAERENDIINSMINKSGDKRINKQLDRLPKKLREEMIENKITIEIFEGLIDYYPGEECYGQYTYDTNLIELDSNDRSIEISCIHELFHSYEDIHDEVLHTDEFIQSWMSDEVYLPIDYQREYNNEYWAQCCQLYFDGELPKDTTIYNIIDNVINSYK